jgi:hypothetical protein
MNLCKYCNTLFQELSTFYFLFIYYLLPRGLRVLVVMGALCCIPYTFLWLGTPQQKKLDYFAPSQNGLLGIPKLIVLLDGSLQGYGVPYAGL